MNLWKFLHIWRRLHSCWVTEHICSLFLALKDIEWVETLPWIIVHVKTCHDWLQSIHGNVGKTFNSSHFIWYVFFTEQTIHGNFSTIAMSNANYRCVQSHNISLDFAKLNTHFCLLHKKTCQLSFMVMNQLIDVLLSFEKTIDVFCHPTSV